MYNAIQLADIAITVVSMNEMMGEMLKRAEQGGRSLRLNKKIEKNQIEKLKELGYAVKIGEESVADNGFMGDGELKLVHYTLISW